MTPSRSTASAIAGIAIPDTAFGNVKADVLERTLPTYLRPDFCD
jgi:hypothetical protein